MDAQPAAQSNPGPPPAHVSVEHGGAARVTAFERILIPLDGSARAEAALGWVHLLPARQIRLLQVCPQEVPDGADAATYLAEVAARSCPPGVAIDIRVGYGGPAEGIVSDAIDADLIVMCTQGAGDGGRRLFGSVADRVARHAPVPTLLLRGGRDPVATAPLRRIVVPLDGSPAAERALVLAAKLASMLDTRVHLVSVHDREASDEPDSGRNPGGLPALSNDGLSAYLEQKAVTMRSHDVATSTEARSGAPAEELLATVGPGDLLVITTHGRGEARRWQIGRVAEKLLRHAPAPIVLIRADSH